MMGRGQKQAEDGVGGAGKDEHGRERREDEIGQEKTGRR